MKRQLSALLVSLPALAACQTTPDYDQPLPEGAPALIPVEDPGEIPDFSPQWYEQDEILSALDRSLAWTRRKHAEQFFPIAGVTHERALRSLERFRELLLESPDPEALDRALRSEFQVYKSAGWDGRGGGVLFTGYCTPIFDGRLEPDTVHRYPLYALPSDLVKGEHGEILGWQTQVGLMPYPSRGAIEAGGILEERNLELAWLASPMDAYIAHVNGSAFIRLQDGDMLRLGYAGKNGRTYRSLGRALVQEGVIERDQMSLAAIRRWAAETDPETVLEYLSRNDNYVFFQPIDGNPHGSLDFEVQEGRSVATDKTIFPRGALLYVRTSVPGQGPFEQFAFDQDTGGAIRTAGRADLYFGIGEEAEEIAGRVSSEGQLFYLFLRE